MWKRPIATSILLYVGVARYPGRARTGWSHAYQADETSHSVARKASDDPFERNYRDGLVERVNLDVGLFAKNLPRLGLAGEPVER
jgi:hypothetical protein